MLKFENVDVIASLGAIMRQNTEFYRSDFEIDKEIIEQAAVSDDDEDKYLLWMSRPAGTYCFRERETYIQGTRQHNTWKYYGEQTRDRILAYAVELNTSRGRKVYGTVYVLDYQQHFQHIKAAALSPSTNRLTYQRGIRDIPPDAPFDGYPDSKLGPLLRYDILPPHWTHSWSKSGTGGRGEPYRAISGHTAPRWLPNTGKRFHSWPWPGGEHDYLQGQTTTAPYCRLCRIAYCIFFLNAVK